jgi:nucleotide-binding universal stress UspA family protein
MKTIIAATDFSTSSLNAVKYAAALAVATGNTLTIVHVSQAQSPKSNESSVPKTDQMVSEAEKQMRQLKETITGDSGLTINTEILFGSVVTSIRKYCKQLDPWVVIMGAEKAGALQRFFLGGRTIEAMQTLEWPVIIVPTGVQYKPINRVGIACDLEDVQNTLPVSQLEGIRKVFSAEVFVLHVKTVDTKREGSNTEDQAKKLRSILGHMSPKFIFIDGASVEDSIENVALQNSIDLLVIVPKKHGFFHRLFYDRQSTRMVLSSQVPMLSIHQ